jgi:hypothetical protein
MAIEVREPESNFTPAPEGLHVAACCDVVDLGLRDTGFGEKHQVEIRWMLEDENERGLRYIVRRRYTASLSEKASLRKDLETWRGRKFAPAELKGFDLEKLLGAGCQVQVVHKMTDQGKTFANVSAVIPLGKGQQSPGVSPDYIREVARAKGGAMAEADDEAVPF